MKITTGAGLAWTAQLAGQSAAQEAGPRAAAQGRKLPPLKITDVQTTLCKFFGVRTAWHGPGDCSPVGHAANIHLDLATPNFGVQESREFNQAERDIFPGAPEIRNGYFQVTDRPGRSVDLDETLAKKFFAGR